MEPIKRLSSSDHGAVIQDDSGPPFIKDGGLFATIVLSP
jgi:hypothetical protein